MSRRDPEADLDFALKHAGWMKNGHLPARKGDVTVIPLTELLRRNEESNRPDGYPATVTGGGTSGGDVSRPTENAARALVDDDLEAVRQHADQVHRAVTGIEEHLRKAAEHLQQAVSLSYLVHRLSSLRKVNEPTPCQACSKLVACTQADPLRKGYCSACRMAWTRYSDDERAQGREPDRAAFERTRGEEAAA